MPDGSRIVMRVAAEADIPTPGTDQVALFADSDLANAPAFKDETGTVTALEGATGSVGPTGPGYEATSATSFTPGTGSKAFTTQAGLAYTAGARVRASSAAGPTTTYMEGVCTAYSSTTLTVTIDLFAGSGPHTDWDLNLAGDQGIQGIGVPPTVVAHGTLGATETFDYSAGPAHEGTLNAACTITLTGAVAGECIMSLGLTEDGTGTWGITLPGSVVNAAALSAALITTAGAYNLIVLRTVDSGVTWFGILESGTGATGAQGKTGGAVSIPYTFSTTTTDSDPGNGTLRLSNATQTSAVTIRADLLSSDGTDWSAVLATLADSTNTVKGHIRLFLTADPTKWLVFSVSALASPAGYKNITVANVAGSTASPFANADAITLSFTRAGDVGASGTASVGSDPIWDAAGDLAVGTGADAAGKLTKGNAGGVLAMGNSAVIWNAGTSFPGSKATGDRWWRTDLGLEFYWDGTRWLTTHLYVMGLLPINDAASVQPISGSPIVVHRSIAPSDLYDMWIVDFRFTARVQTPNSGTSFWTVKVTGGSDLGSANTSADGVSVTTRHVVAIGALMGVTNPELKTTATKTVTPGNLDILAAGITFRFVGT